MGGGVRECGDCIVCCVYPRINDPELTKAGMEHCPHLTLPGPVRENMAWFTGASCENCKIYDRQPKMCAAYKCVWLLGHGAEDDRPDKSLMLFDNSHGIGNAMQAKPLAPDREKTPEAKATIERMSASLKMPVLVVNFYERRIQYVVGKGV